MAIYFITSTLQRISLSVLSMFMNEKYEKFQWGQVDSVKTAEIVGITEMLFPSQIKNSLPFVISVYGNNPYFDIHLQIHNMLNFEFCRISENG